MSKLRLTNAEIDARLVGRALKRIGEFVNVSLKIEYKCTIDVCGYTWLAKTSHILAGSGCPRCSNRLRYTNEDVDRMLIGRSLKRIGNYINAHTKIEFGCTIEECGYKWFTTPHLIFHGKVNCPKCVK